VMQSGDGFLTLIHLHIILLHAKHIRLVQDLGLSIAKNISIGEVKQIHQRFC